MRTGAGAAFVAARRRACHLLRTVGQSTPRVRSALSGLPSAFASLPTPHKRGAFGIAVLTPVIMAGAVGASAPMLHTDVNTAVTPLAAVEQVRDRSGPSVVAALKPPSNLHVAGATVSAPPPAVVVNSPGALGIPGMALKAYRNAERMMAAAYPGCGVSWNLLAGIGRIESAHVNGGATDANGTAVRPIYGPALDGTLPGNEIIIQSVQAGRVSYARAMGPMQFLPGTWARYASDGDGDGRADVQNVFDASLAAARYLCSGGLNLRDSSQVMTAILRYNNSVAYARNVLGWAAAYATGVVPVDLPPITGSIPPIGVAHLDNPEGLGPGLPANALGLPAGDPLALIPLFGASDTASRVPTTNVPGFAPGQLLGPLPGPAQAAPPPQPAAPPPWTPPWEQPKAPKCVVFCLGEQAPPPPAPAPPAGPLPPAGPVPGEPSPGPIAPGPTAALPPVLGPAPGPAA